MTAEKLIKSLISYYSLNNMSELSLKLKISQSVISNWRARNSIGAIVEKINEIDEKALYHIFQTDNITINQGNKSRAAGRNYEEQNNDFSNAKLKNKAIGVNNTKGKTINSSESSLLTSYMPDFIFDDLENLFKRCGEDKKDELIDAIDKLTFEFKKKCRG